MCQVLVHLSNTSPHGNLMELIHETCTSNKNTVDRGGKTCPLWSRKTVGECGLQSSHSNTKEIRIVSMAIESPGWQGTQPTRMKALKALLTAETPGRELRSVRGQEIIHHPEPPFVPSRWERQTRATNRKLST